MEILDKFATLKNKYIRANHSKSATKELSTKAIMLRLKLKNQFPKTITQEFKMKHNKFMCKYNQKTFKQLLRKFGSDITDSKKFWPKVKPLFPQRNKIKQKKKMKKL